MKAARFLIVTADDFGIGPDTTHGILDLAGQQLLTATVLLVNAPHAEAAVADWKRAGRPLELGWHPCLTLDGPVAPAGQVSSLVNRDGRFWALGTFLQRMALGLLKTKEIEAELRAQWRRFVDLVGHAPTVVNAHHHVHVFPLVAKPLARILGETQPLPYVRRIREPWNLLVAIPGARLKRALLTLCGQADAGRATWSPFPGNEWLAGITDPRWVADPEFQYRWLTRIPGQVVELTCHPGYLDTSLIGRDGSLTDGQLHRRVAEYNLLTNPRFREACRRADFTLIAPATLAPAGSAPAALASRTPRGTAHAA